MWSLYNGQSEDHAVAKAQARELTLTDEETAYALAWARNAILAARAMNLAPKGTRLCDVLDRCGVPWREMEGNES